MTTMKKSLTGRSYFLTNEPVAPVTQQKKCACGSHRSTANRAVTPLVMPAIDFGQASKGSAAKSTANTAKPAPARGRVVEPLRMPSVFD